MIRLGRGKTKETKKRKFLKKNGKKKSPSVIC